MESQPKSFSTSPCMRLKEQLAQQAQPVGQAGDHLGRVVAVAVLGQFGGSFRQPRSLILDTHARFSAAPSWANQRRADSLRAAERTKKSPQAEAWGPKGQSWLLLVRSLCRRSYPFGGKPSVASLLATSAAQSSGVSAPSRNALRFMWRETIICRPFGRRYRCSYAIVRTCAGSHNGT